MAVLESKPLLYSTHTPSTSKYSLDNTKIGALPSLKTTLQSFIKGDAYTTRISHLFVKESWANVEVHLYVGPTK